MLQRLPGKRYRERLVVLETLVVRRLDEQSDAPKPPNRAFSHRKDNRGGWVILVVHLAESADRDMLLFHVARFRRCTLRYLVSANYEKPLLDDDSAARRRNLASRSSYCLRVTFSFHTGAALRPAYANIFGDRRSHTDRSMLEHSRTCLETRGNNWKTPGANWHARSRMHERRPFTFRCLN